VFAGCFVAFQWLASWLVWLGCQYQCKLERFVFAMTFSADGLVNPPHSSFSSIQFLHFYPTVLHFVLQLCCQPFSTLTSMAGDRKGIWPVKTYCLSNPKISVEVFAGLCLTWSSWCNLRANRQVRQKPSDCHSGVKFLAFDVHKSRHVVVVWLQSRSPARSCSQWQCWADKDSFRTWCCCWCARQWRFQHLLFGF